MSARRPGGPLPRTLYTCGVNGAPSAPLEPRAFRPPAGRELVVVAGVRTPFGKGGGALRTLGASELCALAIRELLVRGPVAGSAIEEAIFGCVGPEATEANPARVAALRAGLPVSMPASTVNRNCASGMEAILAAARRIALAEADVLVCGGFESMSRYPLTFGPAAVRFFEGLAKAKSLPRNIAAVLRMRPSMLRPRISLLEGLTDPICGLNMGQTAELLARQWNISREEQDQFALRSHALAAKAQSEHYFSDEVIPVYPGSGLGPLESDESVRRGQTLEQLAKLRPYFDRSQGTVTVGNSCPVSDGAVALIVAAAERAEAEGWPTLGRLAGFAVSALDPARMGLGPVLASAKILSQTGHTMPQIDLWELNEAFAAQVLACLRAFDDDAFARTELGWPKAPGAPPLEKLNIHGGAIALGHPVGASGARLALTALRALERRGGSRAVTALCVGGGQGVAMLWERRR